MDIFNEYNDLVRKFEDKSDEINVMFYPPIFLDVTILTKKDWNKWR